MLDALFLQEQDQHHRATGPRHESQTHNIIGGQYDSICYIRFFGKFYYYTVQRLSKISKIFFIIHISHCCDKETIYKKIQDPAQGQGRTNDAGNSDLELCPLGIDGADGDSLKDT